MTGRAVFLALAGAAALPAIAWACTCATHVSEERFFTVSSITQLDGPATALSTELARWDGKTKLTTTSEGVSKASLWLRVYLSDEKVRNVYISGSADVTDTELSR